MDSSSVHERLNAVFRHLLQQPCEANPVLHKVLLTSRHLQKQEAAEAVIIGGMVLDIHATPSIPANPRTTTPGKVNYVLGGVARNVAECMSKLGSKPYMISALGLDMAGDFAFYFVRFHMKSPTIRNLLEHSNIEWPVWKVMFYPLEIGSVLFFFSFFYGTRKYTVGALEICWPVYRRLIFSSYNLLFITFGIRRQKDIDTAVVSNILDVNGELAAAVASVESIEKFLTPDWIRQFIHHISSASVLMVDANLSPPALAASCKIAAECNIPVWFEPVSITVVSPNEDELVAMANALSGENMFRPIDRNKHSAESLFQTLKPAILVLLEKGIRLVVLTLGSDGVLLCSKELLSSMRIGLRKTKPYGFSRDLYKTVTSRCHSSRYSGAMEPAGGSQFFAVHFPALPASVVRLTGAGDCLVGGTLASISSGLDVMQSVAVGIAAAKAAVEAETNVPAQFNLTAIADDAKTVYAAANVLFYQSML
ncbi:PfkB-like carbohydrate kinase family protein [Citrus sinensis]|nr:PfkB-like carbohydrate kinase family protein [Citrus sinensis]